MLYAVLRYHVVSPFECDPPPTSGCRFANLVCCRKRDREREPPPPVPPPHPPPCCSFHICLRETDEWETAMGTSPSASTGRKLMDPKACRHTHKRKQGSACSPPPPLPPDAVLSPASTSASAHAINGPVDDLLTTAAGRLFRPPVTLAVSE